MRTTLFQNRISKKKEERNKTKRNNKKGVLQGHVCRLPWLLQLACCLKIFVFRNSTLISATELSLRQERATTSTFMFTSSHSNPSLLDGSYEGLKFPRKLEKYENRQIWVEKVEESRFSWKLQVSKTTTNSRFQNTRLSQHVVPESTTC